MISHWFVEKSWSVKWENSKKVHLWKIKCLLLDEWVISIQFNRNVKSVKVFNLFTLMSFQIRIIFLHLILATFFFPYNGSGYGLGLLCSKNDKYTIKPHWSSPKDSCAIFQVFVGHRICVKNRLKFKSLFIENLVLCHCPQISFVPNLECCDQYTNTN